MEVVSPIKRTFSGRDGRLVLEAAIIFPVAIAITFTLTYAGIILYHCFIVKTVVDHSAQMAAKTWDGGLSGFTDNGAGTGFAAGGLYRRIIDNERQNKIDAVEGFVTSEIKARAFIEPLKTHATVEVADHILYRTIIVKAEVSFNTPIRNFTYTSLSKAVIKDPAEHIRNIDFVIEIKEEIEKKFPGLTKGTEKMADIMKNIKKAMGSTLPGGDSG